MLSGGARGSRDNVSVLPIGLNKGIMGRGSTNLHDDLLLGGGVNANNAETHPARRELTSNVTEATTGA